MDSQLYGVCKKALLACIYICIGLTGISQDTIELSPGKRWDSSFDTNLYTAFYTDVTNKKSINEVREELCQWLRQNIPL